MRPGCRPQQVRACVQPGRVRKQMRRSNHALVCHLPPKRIHEVNWHTAVDWHTRRKLLWRRGCAHACAQPARRCASPARTRQAGRAGRRRWTIGTPRRGAAWPRCTSGSWRSRRSPRTRRGPRGACGPRAGGTPLLVARPSVSRALGACLPSSRPVACQGAEQRAAPLRTQWLGRTAAIAAHVPAAYVLLALSQGVLTRGPVFHAAAARAAAALRVQAAWRGWRAARGRAASRAAEAATVAAAEKAAARSAAAATIQAAWRARRARAAAAALAADRTAGAARVAAAGNVRAAAAAAAAAAVAAVVIQVPLMWAAKGEGSPGCCLRQKEKHWGSCLVCPGGGTSVTLRLCAGAVWPCVLHGAGAASRGTLRLHRARCEEGCVAGPVRDTSQPAGRL